MYGKEASNRKQEIDRQHHTIPKQRSQRPKDNKNYEFFLNTTAVVLTADKKGIMYNHAETIAVLWKERDKNGY